LPGTDTLIWSVPCCTTLAPVVPVPFTLDSRMLIAWAMSPDDGGLPFMV
jgi:hypothetical protein